MRERRSDPLREKARSVPILSGKSARSVPILSGKRARSVSIRESARTAPRSPSKLPAPHNAPRVPVSALGRPRPGLQEEGAQGGGRHAGDSATQQSAAAPAAAAARVRRRWPCGGASKVVATGNRGGHRPGQRTGEQWLFPTSLGTRSREELAPPGPIRASDDSSGWGRHRAAPARILPAPRRTQTAEGAGRFQRRRGLP